MVSISTAGNVETTAYAVLLQRGFSVRAIEVGGEPLLVAQKGDHDFRGYSAIELLGLIAVYEERGENWKPEDTEVDQLVQFLSDLDNGTRTKN